jgi:uncharacterized membrane protein YkvA (DUF1232 family)
MGNKVHKWREWAGRLKQRIYALYLAYKDPRVRWYAKIFGAVVVAYAFSPIDLIPDFIPILGFVDDLILLPLGIGKGGKSAGRGEAKELDSRGGCSYDLGGSLDIDFGVCHKQSEQITV